MHLDVVLAADRLREVRLTEPEGSALRPANREMGGAAESQLTPH